MKRTLLSWSSGKDSAWTLRLLQLGEMEGKRSLARYVARIRASFKRPMLWTRSRDMSRSYRYAETNRNVSGAMNHPAAAVRNQ